MLSPHFSLREFTRSALATRHSIDNSPPPHVVENMQRLCVAILEPLRASAGPITVSSGYRSPSLNRLAGGSHTSQHTLGEAADIECSGLSTHDLAGVIAALGLPFDQLILEFASETDPHAGWVHVSHRETNNRGEVLRASKDKAGRTRYDYWAPAPVVSPPYDR